jgi:hypothetical protein
MSDWAELSFKDKEVPSRLRFDTNGSCIFRRLTAAAHARKKAGICVKYITQGYEIYYAID